MRFSSKLRCFLTFKLKNQTNFNKMNTENFDSLKIKIGLEIHARILSKSKIFSDSDCSEIKSSLINSQVAFFDAAFPGTMPCINEESVKIGLVTALALNCKINTVSFFERKHYFYADLPAGYQITQQTSPIAFNGNFTFPVINPLTHKLIYKTAAIRRIQLEHDSARTLQTDKLSFDMNKNNKLGENSMLIDLNRAGVGLMEIVTEPVFEEAFDVYSFVRELALVLRSINAAETMMDDGGFRVDVNVSVHKLKYSNDLNCPPEVLPGVRVELKNIATFNEILKATEYEIQRQKQMIKNNEKIKMETRTYDKQSKKTIAIRSKEDQYDYRFMPEPNLLPLVVLPSKSELKDHPELVYEIKKINRFKKTQFFHVDFDEVKQIYFQKVLPQNRRDTLKNQFSIRDEEAFVFVANNLDYILYEIFKISELLEKNNNDDIKLCVTVLLNQYLNQVNTNSNILNIDFTLKCKKIASYIELRKNKKISTRIFLKFFAILFETENLHKLAPELAYEKNFFIVNDTEAICRAMESLMEANPKAINQYKTNPKKRTKILDFFIGRLHKQFNDCTDPDLVDDVVIKCLKKIEE